MLKPTLLPIGLVILALLFTMACSGPQKSKEETSDPLVSIVDTTALSPDTLAQDSAAVDVTTQEEAGGDDPEPAPVGSGLEDSKVTKEFMSEQLEVISRNLEARKLAYVSSLGQDCSGIYHQIKDSLKARITAFADPDQYKFPTFEAQRSSRQIADWYYNNGNLHIVQDGLADRNKIKPGTVIFFGRTDESYSNIDIDLLTNPGKFVHDGIKGKIMHIAVVTSVEKDDQGNVAKYTMMHGRNKRHPASRSSGNWDGPASVGQKFKKFPFGNWNQQWVALANMETPI
jgi:hypothetical protein